MNERHAETTSLEPKRPGFLAALVAVFWSFIGIRRRSDYESDGLNLSIAQVVVAGLIGGAVFVLGVYCLVRVILWNVGPAN